MITVTIVHDLRRMKSNKLYPVKLRITNDRRSKFIETGIDLSKENYIKLSSKHRSKDLNETKEKLLELQAKANSIIKALHPFNFPAFKERFKQKTYDSTFLETLYTEIINKLKGQGRIGTADN